MSQFRRRRRAPYKPRATPVGIERRHPLDTNGRAGDRHRYAAYAARGIMAKDVCADTSTSYPCHLGMIAYAVPNRRAGHALVRHCPANEDCAIGGIQRPTPTEIRG